MDLQPIGEEEDKEEDIRLVEEDTLLEERDEEAQLARGQFQLQCDRLIECIVVSSRDVNELISLYNEINNSTLPVSLKLTLGLICSRLFRSMGDLDDTACELSRLVELYSAPWDGRAEALRRLHAQYRRNCRLLNAAIRRLHLATAGSEQFRTVRILSKWEQLFSSVMLARGVGRRWKFKIPQLRGAASKGPAAIEAFLANEFRQVVAPSGIAVEDGDGNLSQEQDADTLFSKDESANKSTSGSEDNAEEEENEEDEDDDFKDLDAKYGRNSVSVSADVKEKKSVRFTDENHTAVDQMAEDYDEASLDPLTSVASVPLKRPVMESVGCWTHEPEFDKRLVIRLFRPTGLRIATGNKEGQYALRYGPTATSAMQSSGFFTMGASALASSTATLPVADFIVDARTILPDDAQLDLFIGDRATAVGSINLRQLHASDPSPLLLPHANAPLPDDYPFAVRMSVPMYSTSLGVAVRVAVGTVPVSVFGIRHEIIRIADCATLTDVSELLLAPSPSLTPTPTLPGLSPPSPRTRGGGHAGDQVAGEAKLQRQHSRHSIALSPVRWDSSNSIDRGHAIEGKEGKESESVADLRRKFQDQQRYMSQAMRSMEAELRQLRQRQAECDNCSGRSRLYGQVSSDVRIGRGGGTQRIIAARNSPVTGTPVPPVRTAGPESLAYDRLTDSVTLPAIFMPSALGHAYNSRASNYFHPIGHAGRRVTQPPSVFAMQVPNEGGVNASTVNLYALAVRQSELMVNDQRLKMAQQDAVPKPQQGTKETRFSQDSYSYSTLPGNVNDAKENKRKK